jgi:transcriptional regulator with XRE-family HTH domain
MKRVEVSDFAERIGIQLRALRVGRGMTQAQLAKAMGSHCSVIARLERGELLQSLESIARYARACGYDVHDVLVCLMPQSESAAQLVNAMDVLSRSA